MAHQLAAETVRRHLAVCVQVEGPVTACYRWEGKVEQATEYRLNRKFWEAQAGPLEAYVLAQHPYATPEWIVVQVEHVGEKYLSWAMAVSTPSPL